eukprot:55451-Chlamydomonas_euryale.AAC.1
MDSWHFTRTVSAHRPCAGRQTLTAQVRCTRGRSGPENKNNSHAWALLCASTSAFPDSHLTGELGNVMASPSLQRLQRLHPNATACYLQGRDASVRSTHTGAQFCPADGPCSVLASDSCSAPSTGPCSVLVTDPAASLQLAPAPSVELTLQRPCSAACAARHGPHAWATCMDHMH